MGTVNANRSLGTEVPGSGADCGNDVRTIETGAGVSIPGHCKRNEENNFITALSVLGRGNCTQTAV